MIKVFDKTTCRLLSQEIDKALADVAIRHGLTVRPAGGQFSETTFTAKVELRLAQSNPASQEAEQNEFARYCVFYGLEPKHYGMKLVTTRGEMTLVGFEIKRPKFPIKVRDSAGKLRLFTADVIKRLQKPGELIEESAP